MNRALDFASLLIGGELLAYGWQPHAIDPAQSSTWPSAVKIPWALACGATATLWALRRITGRSRQARALHPQSQPEIPSTHEKRDRQTPQRIP
jgi:hypothetical protein